MKKLIGLLLIVLTALFMLAGCRQRVPDETAKPQMSNINQ